MILLLDIGNTNTHLGLANGDQVTRQADIPTRSWSNGTAQALLRKFVRKSRIEASAFCSVVPKASGRATRALKKLFGVAPFELTSETIEGVGIDYPNPKTIGPDRLANAVAALHRYGAPSVVVDFGTAVTFDVVDRRGNYTGGIIAPGLASMTDYLHEKTALLPRIKIAEVDSVIGKSTVEAMTIGAVHGYRGLIRELLMEIRKEFRTRKLSVVATGGYAELMAARLPEITEVDPLLTLEGLLIVLRTKAVIKSRLS